jgi:hypothetical protein
MSDQYKICRGNIEHEDDLINHRLSWLVLAQSFLFAACISAKQTPCVVRAVGIAICVATYISIIAAIWSIRCLRRHYSGEIPAGYPPLVGAKPLHGLGLFAPIIIPPIFILGWLLL